MVGELCSNSNLTFLLCVPLFRDSVVALLLPQMFTRALSVWWSLWNIGQGSHGYMAHLLNVCSINTMWTLPRFSVCALEQWPLCHLDLLHLDLMTGSARERPFVDPRYQPTPWKLSLWSSGLLRWNCGLIKRGGEASSGIPAISSSTMLWYSKKVLTRPSRCQHHAFKFPGLQEPWSSSKPWWHPHDAKSARERSWKE